MAAGLATTGLAAVAGALSTLSPCVLPLVPIVVGSAAAEHRLGPFALAAGLAVSFTAVGVFVAAAGAALGIGDGVFRVLSAALLITFGALLLSGRLQAALTAALSRVAGAGNAALARFRPQGLGGQFVLGLLLGMAWSPCVGPTLGATITLASRGEDLGQATVVMAAFGLGAAAPLVLLGLLSHAAMRRWRGRLLQAGQAGKRAMGMLLVVLGLAVITGADKRLEAWALDHAPAWLADLTTAI